MEGTEIQKRTRQAPKKTYRYKFTWAGMDNEVEVEMHTFGAEIFGPGILAQEALSLHLDGPDQGIT